MIRVAPLVGLVALLGSCGCSHSLIVSRPKNAAVDRAYTDAWVQEIKERGQSGDILMRRGYAVLSDVIVTVTPGDDITHAGIYDAERGVVIDAVNPKIREVPLEDYVRASHRLVVVRPAGLSPRERRDVVARARAKVGTGFDFSGFVGFDNPDRFYCSELVVYAIRARERGLPVDALVIPGQLGRYGATVYDSGERQEARARVAALGSVDDASGF